MTERESILERMSGPELEMFAAQGGTLPRHLVARMNQYKADRMFYGPTHAAYIHSSHPSPLILHPKQIRRAS